MLNLCERWIWVNCNSGVDDFFRNVNDDSEFCIEGVGLFIVIFVSLVGDVGNIDFGALLLLSPPINLRCLEPTSVSSSSIYLGDNNEAELVAELSTTGVGTGLALRAWACRFIPKEAIADEVRDIAIPQRSLNSRESADLCDVVGVSSIFYSRYLFRFKCSNKYRYDYQGTSFYTKTYD